MIAEGIEPKENFPAGPYPSDKLTYKSPTLVEFATPAGKDGSWNRRPAGQGRAAGHWPRQAGRPAADGPDLDLLSVRLPAAQADLAPAIVAAAEATLPDASQ